MKIPTTIITGFLGSGKTTIIQNLVKQLWDQEKIAIIKNEISELGVDVLELDNPKLTVTELANGCICCTLVGQLNDALTDIVNKYHPDRIIIEASGLAKPAQIAISLDLVDDLSIDSVIVIIDALNYEKIKDSKKAWSDRIQTEFIDLYIINKIDQVNKDHIEEIKDDILELNPTARIIETNNADIPAQLIIGLHEKFINFEIDHNHSITEWEYFIKENFVINNIDDFIKDISNLPKNIYRIKGYFSYQNQNFILNSVASKVNIRPITQLLPSNSKLVFIGKDIKKYENRIFL